MKIINAIIGGLMGTGLFMGSLLLVFAAAEAVGIPTSSSGQVYSTKDIALNCFCFIFPFVLGFIAGVHFDSFFDVFKACLKGALATLLIAVVIAIVEIMVETGFMAVIVVLLLSAVFTPPVTYIIVFKE